MVWLVGASACQWNKAIPAFVSRLPSLHHCTKKRRPYHIKNLREFRGLSTTWKFLHKIWACSYQLYNVYVRNLTFREMLTSYWSVRIFSLECFLVCSSTWCNRSWRLETLRAVHWNWLWISNSYIYKCTYFSECDCNGYNPVCDMNTGVCECLSFGVTGSHCQQCDAVSDGDANNFCFCKWEGFFV